MRGLAALREFLGMHRQSIVLLALALFALALWLPALWIHREENDEVIYRTLADQVASKQKGYKNKAREYLRQAQEIYSQVDTSDYEMVKHELLTLD